MSLELNTKASPVSLTPGDGAERCSRLGPASGAVLPAFLLLLLLAASPAGAAVDPYRLYLAERGEIPWESLSREEREALQRHRGSWDNYSTERQQRMRQGAQRYLELPPDKRRAVEQQRRQYEQLPPDERKRLREEYRRKRR
ncbi:MAG: DUF3106 domain-containing protein [Gammaproteobacteria bacterium]|jgi:hypothetical protein